MGTPATVRSHWLRSSATVMAVSFKKLKIDGEHLSGAQLVSYLADAQAAGDYYSEDETAPMNWLATPLARRRYALEDYGVSKATLRFLIEGTHPISGRNIRNHGSDKTMVGAQDVTMSPAPKSVSILWALGDDQLRFDLELFVRKANGIAINRLLKEQPLVRRRVAPGPSGIVPVKAENYVGVQVMHTTARMTANDLKVPDPQLHVHNLLIGAVTPTGELRALDSKVILDYIAALDAEASAYLAAELQAYGFELEWKLEYRKETGQPRMAWEVMGVPASLIKAMSRRTSEIEDLKAQYRKATGREALGPSWDAFVVAQRGQKAKLSPSELRAWWLVEAEEHGLDAASVDRLVAQADERRAAGIPKPNEDSEGAAELRRLILEHVCRQHAFVPVAEVERLAWQLAVTRVDPRTADRVLARMVGDGDLIVTSDQQVTTLEVLAQEQRTRRAAAELLRASPESPVAAELVEAELERRASEGRPFDEHQEASLRLAVSGARFVSISGKAGTGKSNTMAAMSALWHGQGRRVIATAVPGRTAQKAAVESNADIVLNLDQFRVQVENGQLQLTPGDVVLAEEAGQIDHHRYAPLLEAVNRSGATLVQLGDDKQLSPVGPGGLWTVLHRQAEEAGRAAQLRVVYRAHTAREAEAWDDLRDGRITRALTWIRDEGRLHLYETRPELRAGVVEAWWAGNRDGMMIVDTSNEERDQLNALAQAKRLEAGELGDQFVQLENGRQVRRGDRVLFNTIYSPADLPRSLRVENGTPARVLRVDPEHRRVELQLEEPKQERRLEVGTDAPIELGYARHVQKAQGVNIEDTDIAVSRRTRRNQLYVMGSRARSGARVHVLTADLETVTSADPDTPSPAAAERPGLAAYVAYMAQLDAREDLGPAERAALAQAAAAEFLRQPRGAPVRRESQAATLDGDDGEPTADELATTMATIEAERAEREAIAELTIEQIGRRAQPESTKEAVGDRPPLPAAPWESERIDLAEDRQVDDVQRNEYDEDQAVHVHERGWAPLEREPAAMELPLPHREPDLAALRFDDGTTVARGQVVRFSDPAALVGAARSEVQPEDLGVVLGCHRGGVTFDYVTVELVGGRRVEVWQTASGITVEPDLEPAAVRDAIPRPDQRDPVALNVYELVNGTRLMAGDQVRFTEPAALDGVGRVEAGAEALVDDIERHRYNRAVLALSDGRKTSIYRAAQLEIVRPVQEPTPFPAPGASESQPATPNEPAGRRVRPGIAHALPARDADEMIARRYMEAHDVAGSLARYGDAGKLLQVQDPIARAAELLIADPGSIAVAMDIDAELRLREAVAAQLSVGPAGGRSQAATVEAQETHAATPAEAPAQQAAFVTPAGADVASRIVQADVAYEARLQRREAWLRKDPARLTSPVPEPHVAPRAYVVAGHLGASRALTRAVSVAAESHVLTTPLRLWLAQEVELAAARLSTAEEQEAGRPTETEAERAREQAERHRELAYERRVDDRTPGAVRASERERESEARR